MDVCVYCGEPFDGGIIRGAGDGRGQRFAHEKCYYQNLKEEAQMPMVHPTKDDNELCVVCGQPASDGYAGDGLVAHEECITGVAKAKVSVAEEIARATGYRDVIFAAFD